MRESWTSLLFAALVIGLVAACGTGSPKTSVTPTPSPVLFPTVVSEDTGFATATPLPIATAKPAGTVKADIVDFEHLQLVINHGVTVAWTNLGQTQHTVTSGGLSSVEGGTGLFSSGPIKPGETFSLTFSDLGSFKFFCEFHSDVMNGFIQVVVVGGQSGD